jgi:hypothetical protein
MAVVLATNELRSNSPLCPTSINIHHCFSLEPLPSFSCQARFVPFVVVLYFAIVFSSLDNVRQTLRQGEERRVRTTREVSHIFTVFSRAPDLFQDCQFELRNWESWQTTIPCWRSWGVSTLGVDQQWLTRLGGSFGVVYKAIERSTGEFVAIKHVSRSHAGENVD